MTKRRTDQAITAKELMTQLESDPEWLQRQAERRGALEMLWAELRKAEQPVVEALRSAGLELDAVWDLLSWEEPYPEAIPILLEHIRKPYPDKILEKIGRALGVQEARAHWQELMQLYRDAKGDHAKDGLAIALSEIAHGDAELLDDIIELVRDPSLGSSRILLLRVLSGSRKSRAYDTLVDMRDDPDLCKEIAVVLKRKKPPQGSR